MTDLAKVLKTPEEVGSNWIKFYEKNLRYSNFKYAFGVE